MKPWWNIVVLLTYSKEENKVALESIVISILGSLMCGDYLDRKNYTWLKLNDWNDNIKFT